MHILSNFPPMKDVLSEWEVPLTEINVKVIDLFQIHSLFNFKLHFQKWCCF